MGSAFSSFICLAVWQRLSAQQHGQAYEKACQNKVFFMLPVTRMQWQVNGGNWVIRF